MKNIELIIGAFVIALAVIVAPYLNTGSDSDVSFEGSLRLCNGAITETLVTLGNQSATTILTPGTRQWVIIQQPLNATNTLALSFGGTAVIGQGYELSVATTSIAMDEFSFGFSTKYPMRDAVSAISDTGSSTAKVLTCK